MMTMPFYDCDETDKAVGLYFKRMRASGVSEVAVMQPSRHETQRDGNLVYVAAGGRLLACFRVGDDGRLRRYQPSERRRATIEAAL